MSERDDVEREQVEWVFRLTGGELENKSWAGHKYWYDGVPDYVGEDFAGDETDTQYRTVVMQALDAPPSDVIDSEDGLYQLAKVFPSSGEAECSHKYDADNGKIVQRGQCNEHNVCEQCKKAEGDDHGHIYIGDGWVEAVYRLPPRREGN